MDAFLDMGGYGRYVWPAYVISALALGALTAAVVRRRREARRRLAAFEAGGTPDEGRPEDPGAA